MKAEKTAPLLPPCFFCFWLPRANLLAQAKKKEEEHREADRLRKIQEAEACITEHKPIAKEPSHIASLLFYRYPSWLRTPGFQEDAN